MIVTRGYKTEVDVNNQQRTLCLKHAGCARFAYNWGLARKQEAYKRSGTMPSAMELHKELNALKATDYPWMYEVSKCAMQESLRDLDVAHKNAFRRLKEKRGGKKTAKVGWPRFKARNKGIGSFRLTGAIHVHEKSIQLPRLGILRLKEHGSLPTSEVHILSATVSEHAGRWYVSIQVGAPVTGRQFQWDFRSCPLWEWGLLSA